MNTTVAERQEMPAPSVVDDVIARGDLSKLTPQQRVVHYHNVCRSLGLNPYTEPFQYITLNGKLKLYAKKDATDQLRKINGVSISIVSTTHREGLITVTARATDKTGRQDEDIGAVFAGMLKGEAAANAVMKAMTKAKRRVTLSISGLGWLDESEMDAIPHEEPVEGLKSEPAIPTMEEATRSGGVTYAEAVRRDLNARPIEREQSIPRDQEVPAAQGFPASTETSGDAYALHIQEVMRNATSADELAIAWNGERALRGKVEWHDPEQPARLKEMVTRRIEELKVSQDDTR